jgi:hypothetical protein
MWQKTGGTAAKAGSARRPLRAVQQCIVALIHRNASKWNLRHADAHDCRANDAMKVYKRCRQKAVF